MIARRNLRCLKAVIQAGADVNAKNSRGETALSVAVKTRHPEIVTCLIEADADFHAIGYTHLASCISKGNFEVANILVDAGLSCDLSSAAQIGNIGRVKQALREGTKFDRDAEDDPVVLAAKCGQKAIIEILMNDEDYLCRRTETGSLALRLAVLRGDESIVQQLLKYGLDVNENSVPGADRSYSTFSNVYNRRALNLAVEQGLSSIVEILLDHGADPNLRDGKTPYDRIATTPLERIIRTGNLEVARILVEKGADIHVKDYRHESILIRTLDADQDDLACFFIEMGVNLSIKAWSLGSALNLALRKSRCPKAIKMLKERGAPNIPAWTR